MDIQFSPKRIVQVLSACTFILFILHLLSYVPPQLGWRHIPLIPLNFDCEGNLPTLFSSFLLGLCAALAAICAYGIQKQGGKSFLWWLLAVLFLGVGIDESVEFHERISSLVQNTFDTSGYLLFAWVIPYAVALAVLAAIYLRFFLRLPPLMKKRLLLAAVLYIGGGMGIELPESARYDAYGEDWVYHVLITIEELLEFIGCIAFIYAFSTYIAEHLPDTRLRIAK